MKRKDTTDAMAAAAESMTADQSAAFASTLMKLAARNAIDTFKYGTPDMKAALTKTFITAMAKSLEATDEDASKEKLRREFQDLIGLADESP